MNILDDWYSIFLSKEKEKRVFYTLKLYKSSILNSIGLLYCRLLIFSKVKTCTYTIMVEFSVFLQCLFY